MAIEAGRLQLERIESLLNANQSFAIETTLATRSYRNLIKRAKTQGYEIELLFFYLSSPDDAYVEWLCEYSLEGTTSLRMS